MLMNIGFVEALKQYDYDCFIFHDVDLIPEDDRNLYTCPQQPRHMSVAINTMNYRFVIFYYLLHCNLYLSFNMQCYKNYKYEGSFHYYLIVIILRIMRHMQIDVVQ